MKTFPKKRSSTIQGLYLPAVLLLAICTQNSKAQSAVLYSNATNAVWQTPSNWTGGVVPTSTDIAQIGANPTGGGGVGIDMGATTNNGTANQAVGAVEMTSARTSGNPVIGNSSTIANGILTFFGATVNSVPNVIIRNNSTKDLSFANIQGSGTMTMNLALTNTTDNKIVQDAAGKIIISAPITGAANCPLTISGIGASTEVDIQNPNNTFAGLISLKSTETVFSADGCFGAVPGSVTTNAIVIDGGRMTANATYTLNANRGIKVGNTAGTSISVKTGTTIVTYNGVISDYTTAGILVKQGGNVLQLGGINIFTGITGVNNGAIRLINGNDRLPVTTTLNLGQAASSNVGTFDLNGFNQQVAGLNSVIGTNASATAKNTVSTSTTPSTLTLSGAGTYSYGAGTLVNSGIITGGVSLVKNGSGVQVLGDANTYAGSTVVNAGELRFSPVANEVLSSSGVTLNGGTLGTSGISAGKAVTFSTLNVTDNSVINLETTNTHTLAFAASSAVTWNASKTVTITGWQGNYATGTSGTVGHVIVGASASDLTAAQISKIVFYNGTSYYPATMLSTGELVPFCVAPAIISVSSNTAFCAGNTLSLTASASGTYSPTYTWAGPNSFTSALQNPTLTGATSAATGVYTVTATNACGTATAITSVTVNALPTVVANTTSVTICSGQSVTLSGSGASTYTWSGGVSNGTAFAPAATTAYSVTGTDANNCTNTAVVTVSVNTTPTLSVNSGSICAGQSLTLSGSGAVTYTWSTSDNTASINVSPSSSAVYTLSGSNPGCTSSVTTAVTVYTLPVLSANTSTICAGATATLTAGGASTYSWNTGSNSASISVSPSVTTTYTINGASAQGCVSTGTTQVTVNALPALLSFSTSVCSGGTATLTVSGASTYTWSNGSNSTSIVVTPIANTNFTITGTSAQNCVNTITTGIVVTSSPSITVNSATICTGNSTTLTATGLSTYTWSNGANTATIVVNPTINTTYTVSGNTSGCVVTPSNTASVSVNALPVITVNSATICSSTPATLIAAGAATYTWNTGVASATLNPSPASTQVYTVTGTSTLGCINIATSQVSVNASPTLAAASATICAGASATLSVSGAATYTWSTASNASSVVVNPLTTTIYTVSGTNSPCATVNMVTVTVNSLPVVAINAPTICVGSSATLTASGATTYTWNTSSTSTSISVSPVATTVYTVTGTSTLNCINSATTQVTVNGLPTLTVNSASVCTGSSATLAASGATTYSWSTTASTNSITVSPVVNTTYTVFGTILGCTSSQTAAATVYTLPTVTSTSANICSGVTATLTASGATTYTWNTGANGSVFTSNPLSNTNYTVTGTSSQGCANSFTTLVTVMASPVITVNSASVCAGTPATLTANGSIIYLWNNGTSGSVITVTPQSTTTYTVGGSSAQGCIGVAVATVVVNALPVVSLNAGAATVCVDAGAVALAGTPAGGTYSGTAVTAAAFSPSLAGAGIYTVTYNYTDANNCSGSDHKTITVDLCTGIKQFTAVNNIIHVSPNPAQTEIRIQNETFTGSYSITIFDVNGKQVYSNISSQEVNTVDINNLQNGLYILKITENNKQSTLKFIKN